MFAACIVVVESESFYHQLVQDGFWLNYNCILVTGKGIPDIATQPQNPTMNSSDPADALHYGTNIKHTSQVKKPATMLLKILSIC
jgi:hypothetical protein